MAKQVILPKADRINPLNENDRVTLEGFVQKQHAIHDLLVRAAACGLDVEDRLAKHAVHSQIAHTIRHQFFEGPPPPPQE